MFFFYCTCSLFILFFFALRPLFTQCGKPFVKEDITVINGTEEEMESQRTAMEERRKAARLAKVHVL